MCPDTPGTETLYVGHAAGSFYLHQGGARDICLTNNPNRGMLPATPGTQESGRSLIYGVEYSLTDSPPAFGNLNGDNVPCSACYTALRGDKIMIPGTIDCPAL